MKNRRNTRRGRKKRWREPYPIFSTYRMAGQRDVYVEADGLGGWHVMDWPRRCIRWSLPRADAFRLAEHWARANKLRASKEAP